MFAGPCSDEAADDQWVENQDCQEEYMKGDDPVY